MKILLISFSHHPTLQNYLYLLKKNLFSYNIDVYSLGNSKVSSLYETLENSYFVNCIDSASPSLKSVTLFYKELKKICSILNEIDPDVILFTSKHIWNFFLLWYIKKKAQIYHVFHDPIGHAGTTVNKGVILYNKVLSKLLKGIIVHSKNSYINTIKYIKPKCPIKQVPLGEKMWLPYKKSDGFKNKLLVFGRVSSYKGCEFIPKIAKELEYQNVNCQVMVIGKTLSDVPKDYEQEISKYENITFRNEFIPEKELDDIFYSCDATLILHKSISQSGVIIDAYRHSHPVICFEIDGISEFINEDTAVAVSPFEIEEMVKRIKLMYSDINKFRTLSYNAYKFGEKIFSSEAMAEYIYNFIASKDKNC